MNKPRVSDLNLESGIFHLGEMLNNENNKHAKILQKCELDLALDLKDARLELVQLREQVAKLQADVEQWSNIAEAASNDRRKSIDEIDKLQETIRKIYNHIDAVRGCMCTDLMSDCCKPNLVTACCICAKALSESNITKSVLGDAVE